MLKYSKLIDPCALMLLMTYQPLLVWSMVGSKCIAFVMTHLKLRENMFIKLCFVNMFHVNNTLMNPCENSKIIHLKNTIIAIL